VRTRGAGDDNYRVNSVKEGGETVIGLGGEAVVCKKKGGAVSGKLT